MPLFVDGTATLLLLPTLPCAAAWPSTSAATPHSITGQFAGPCVMLPRSTSRAILLLIHPALLSPACACASITTTYGRESHADVASAAAAHLVVTGGRATSPRGSRAPHAYKSRPPTLASGNHHTTTRHREKRSKATQSPRRYSATASEPLACRYEPTTRTHTLQWQRR